MGAEGSAAADQDQGSANAIRQQRTQNKIQVMKSSIQIQEDVKDDNRATVYSGDGERQTFGGLDDLSVIVPSPQSAAKQANQYSNINVSMKKKDAAFAQDESMFLNNPDVDVHQNSKVNKTKLSMSNTSQLSFLSPSSFRSVHWGNQHLDELFDSQMKPYLTHLERKWRKQSNLYTTQEVAKLCNEQIDEFEYETQWDKNNVKVSWSAEGSVLHPDYPCIMTEYLFDPSFTITDVVSAIQVEKHRRRWDPFMKSSKVISISESMRLQVVYTQFNSFLNVAPRHFFEKKLHFTVGADAYRNSKQTRNSDLLIGSMESMNLSDESGQQTYYTYITSCAKAPRLQGKKSFLDFTNKVGSSSSENQQAAEEQSVEAKTIYAMHKFELVDLPPSQQNLPNPKSSKLYSPQSINQQVKVTMLCQVNLGEESTNQKVYSGMLKAMSLNQLQKSAVEFYDHWNEYMTETRRLRDADFRGSTANSEEAYNARVGQF